MTAEIRINDNPPNAVIEVTRVTGVDPGMNLSHNDDSMYRYEFVVWERNALGGMVVTHRGQVGHRYGDGAPALLARVCRMARLAK